MQEAFLELVADMEVEEPMDAQFGAVPPHTTTTSDNAWDASVHLAQLQAGLRDVAQPNAFALVDGDVRMFMHHEVHNGVVGPANLTACSSAIGMLNGGRGGTTIPDAARQAVYAHLAKHLRDADREPPELMSIAEVEALVASTRPPMEPPIEWFRNPRFDKPTALTVDEDGHVYGHLALWGVCHTSFSNVCVVAPRAPGGDYGIFRKGEVFTSDGTRIPVGQLTMDTGHAPTNLGMAPAAAHYDHTGTAVADVACGEDRFGIWFSGAVRPDATELDIRKLRGAGVSGDWRRHGGSYRLVNALVVNSPGFPIPRLKTFVHDGEQTALVAAGIVLPETVETRTMPVAVADRIAKSIGRDRVARLRERVHPSLGNM
jgi:hypothetical protein